MNIHGPVLATLLVSSLTMTLQSQSCESSGKLIISEYVEGEGFNKALELYNPTDQEVDLSHYAVWKISNGGDWPGISWPLSGELAPGGVYVIASPNADEEILNVAQEVTNFVDFNGNDAIGLAKDNTLIDSVGTDGVAPESGWDVAGTTNATTNHILIRKSEVTTPTTDWEASAGTNPDNAQWIVLQDDDFSTLGSHPHGEASSACTTSEDCLPGLTCVGRPDVEGATGCCTSTAPIPGEGDVCASDLNCGEGLVCILDTCSPAWMEDSFTSSPNATIPDADPSGLVDPILVSCLASVPVAATADILIEHPRPQDLLVTITDAGLDVETVVFDHEAVPGGTLRLEGVPVGNTGDNTVNGYWTLTVTDTVQGQEGTLVEWTLHVSSRWD